LAVYEPTGASSLIANAVVKGVKVSAPITLTDANDTLALGLDKVNVASDFEVASDAPLQKGINLQSGKFELRLNPNLGDIVADTLTSNTEVAVDSVRASTANQVTINDNVIITGDLTVNG
jgi:hypothetical protein